MYVLEKFVYFFKCDNVKIWGGGNEKILVRFFGFGFERWMDGDGGSSHSG